jgi:hypothetical protein
MAKRIAVIVVIPLGIRRLMQYMSCNSQHNREKGGGHIEIQTTSIRA